MEEEEEEEEEAPPRGGGSVEEEEEAARAVVKVGTRTLERARTWEEGGAGWRQALLRLDGGGADVSDG